MLPTLKSCLRRGLRWIGYEIIPTTAALPTPVRCDYDAILRNTRLADPLRLLDPRTCLVAAIKRAHVLGLHACDSLRVLDIGTGAGYFPVVCRHYGHLAIGVDRLGNPVFEDIVKWMKIDRRSFEIVRFTPIPRLPLKFDLVTGFLVTFDQDPRRNNAAWGVHEWRYFLQDVANNHLATGGRMAFVLNDHTLKQRHVIDYFRSVGAEINGSWVLFDSVAFLEKRDGASADAAARRFVFSKASR